MRLEAYLRAAAKQLQGSDTPHLDLRLLAKGALGLSDADLILAVNHQLTDEETRRLDAWLARRRAGEGVAHIVGEKEFHGLALKIAPGILSPRPDTETLVEAATRRLQAGAAPHVLDLGVGSGAILLAVLGHFPKAIGVGVDINWVAAECARDNARRLSLPARILCGDWAAAIDGQFDLVFSNPPYIPEGEADRLAPEVVRFEDPRALFAGADGLEAFRRILPEGRRLLAPRGLMILEFGGGQAEAVRDLARVEFPGAVIAVENDLAGRPRALVIET